MKPPILSLTEVSATFITPPLFINTSVEIGKSDRIALVGRNGSGKSTLLKMMAGLVEPDSGIRFVQPGIRVAYLSQSENFEGYKNLRDYVSSGLSINQSEATYLSDAMLDEVGLGVGAAQRPSVVLDQVFDARVDSRSRRRARRRPF